MNAEDERIFDRRVGKFKEYMKTYKFNIVPASGYDECESDIYKVPVLGYICFITEKFGKKVVCNEPILSSVYDAGDWGDYTLCSGEEVLSILPAAPETVKVMGQIPRDVGFDYIMSGTRPGTDVISLGFEYPGIPHPEWEDKLRDAWENCVYRYEYEKITGVKSRG
jgi:hypothetical protein